MKAYRILVLVALTMSLVSTFNAQVDLQLGARPQGLGGAYVAVANDANAVYWNPSGLSQIDRGEVTIMHWALSDLNQIIVDYGSFAYPVYKGAVGFSWTRQAADLEEGPNNSKSTLTQNTFILSYGLAFTPHISGGLSLNRTTIDSKVGNGAGLGFDFGLMVRPLGTNEWTVGFTAKNVAANMKNESLIPYYIAGTAYKYSSSDLLHNVIVAADVNTRQDIDGKEGLTIKYAAGLEYRLTPGDYSFALRGGIGSKSFSAGIGLGYQFFSLDYAFVKMREETIGDSHKFGLSFYFNK